NTAGATLARTACSLRARILISTGMRKGIIHVPPTFARAAHSMVGSWRRDGSRAVKSRGRFGVKKGRFLCHLRSVFVGFFTPAAAEAPARPTLGRNDLRRNFFLRRTRHGYTAAPMTYELAIIGAGNMAESIAR